MIRFIREYRWYRNHGCARKDAIVWALIYIWNIRLDQ